MTFAVFIYLQRIVLSLELLNHGSIDQATCSVILQISAAISDRELSELSTHPFLLRIPLQPFC